MEDFRVIESRGGMRQWELRAVSAEAYDDRGEILAEGIVVEYYDGGKASSRMWADKGRLDQRSHNLEATSHVVVLSLEDGTKLETEALWWDNSKEVIHTDRPVVMTTKEDDRIEGAGMEALPNMKMITVENVRGVIKNVSRVEKRLNIDG
jgi:LPS export ABC transporter protein LptC